MFRDIHRRKIIKFLNTMRQITALDPRYKGTRRVFGGSFTMFLYCSMSSSMHLQSQSQTGH